VTLRQLFAAHVANVSLLLLLLLLHSPKPGGGFTAEFRSLHILAGRLPGVE